MAIQIPNPGTGNGASGDNEFVLWSKVKDNFSNKTHAASREVGASVGNLVEYTAFGIGDTGLGNNALIPMLDSNNIDDPRTLRNGVYVVDGGYYNGVHGSKLPFAGHSVFFNYAVGNGAQAVQIVMRRLTNKNAPEFYYRAFDNVSSGVWVKVYTNVNTTLDGNGALKPSSPVLRVFNDRIEGNADGDEMAATYTKNGVGDYTITGTTGLRTDGWYIVTPNDINGNPHVAVTLDDTDGVITLKTYARIFDMTTFKFVPDLEQPLDIPEGRWIDLRFNDLPDDTQMEV